MTDANKDIAIGLLFMTGIWSFISGLFILSTISFGSAAVFSTIVMRSPLNN